MRWPSTARGEAVSSAVLARTASELRTDRVYNLAVRHYLGFLVLTIMAALRAGAQGREGGILTGQIVEAYFGQGQAGWVEIENRRIQTDATGHFRFDGLKPGLVVLTTGVAGSKNARLEVMVHDNQRVELPPLPIQVASVCGGAYAELRLLPAVTDGALRGKVQIPRIRGSAKVLTGAQAVLMQGAKQVALTKIERDGQFRFEKVESGSYEAVVRGTLRRKCPRAFRQAGV